MPSDTPPLLPARYRVVRRDIRLGPHNLGLYAVADPNALADQIDPDLFSEDERFPYWAELWPSGVALARFVLGKRIGRAANAVELGCGLGLAGVAAAIVGARVLFTDLEPDALAFARANHALNLARPARTRLLDWRKTPRDLKASLVLAADVLYERRFIEPFLRTLEVILAPEGAAYVAEPGRTVAEGAVESLETKGFARDLHLEEFEFEGRHHAVWIHEIRRRLPIPNPQPTKDSD